MQNKEKLLSIDDAYDVAFDYLKKYYQAIKSEDVLSILSGMPLVANGSSVDPAIKSDWSEAVDKLLTQNTNLREKFELAEKKLNIQQAFQLMITFLDTYNYFDEIVDLVNKMKLVENNMSRDPELWSAWTESVNKILNQNPRVRPLFFFTTTKLTNEDVYESLIDWLDKFYQKTKSKDIKYLLTHMKHIEYKNVPSNLVWQCWNKSLEGILYKVSVKTQNPKQEISVQDAYDVIMHFLMAYANQINSNEIAILIKGMAHFSDREPNIVNEFRDSWTESVNKTLNKYRTF